MGANNTREDVRFDDTVNTILDLQEGIAMKVTCISLVFAALALTACAHPLEGVVDVRHRARIDAANANRPLVNGAADGLGTYIARDHELEMQQAHAVDP